MAPLKHIYIYVHIYYIPATAAASFLSGDGHYSTFTPENKHGTWKEGLYRLPSCLKRLIETPC